MKKYITTDKHPQLKEGVVLTGTEYFNTERSILDFPCLDNAIENGFVNEIQEPKLTDDDMIELLEDFAIEFEVIRTDYIQSFLEKWKNERNK